MQNDDVLLKVFFKEWKDYTTFVYKMRKIFDYVVRIFFTSIELLITIQDRIYLKNSNNVSLATTALLIFKDECFKNHDDLLRRAVQN